MSLKPSDPNAQTICFCHSVSLGDLRAAYEKGAKTLKKIQSETMASTGCGGCEYDVCDVIEALEAEAKAPVSG